MPELTRRYIVMAMASEAPFDPTDPEGVFVLKPWKDPAALRALELYRDSCYPELARDLAAWIVSIRSGPTIRGGVGARNEPYVVAAGPARERPASPARRPARPVAKRPAPRPGKRAAAKRTPGKRARKRR
jgi:hypothetical protein